MAILAREDRSVASDPSGIAIVELRSHDEREDFKRAQARHMGLFACVMIVMISLNLPSGPVHR